MCQKLGALGTLRGGGVLILFKLSFCILMRGMKGLMILPNTRHSNIVRTRIDAMSQTTFCLFNLPLIAMSENLLMGQCTRNKSYNYFQP